MSEIRVDFQKTLDGIPAGTPIEISLLDDRHDADPVRCEPLASDGRITLTLPLYTTVLLTAKGE